MKQFKNKITLLKNARGCYILDTIKGCSICKTKPKGCYNNCYAKSIADRYKLDFDKITKRDFDIEKNQLFLFDFIDKKDSKDVIKKIKQIEMPFIRIGEMGDPSEDWEHTINICKTISQAQKPIVIVTKHWKTIPEHLLKQISEMNLIINTSISALDTDQEIKHRLEQYNILKKYCKSVLRVLTCDFNVYNKVGAEKKKIQDTLLENENVIDTIFRPSVINYLVEKEIINIDLVRFLNKKVWASIYNKKTYFGRCDKCNIMCGLNF